MTANDELREVVRQMLADWEGASPAERDEAIERAAEVAAAAAREAGNSAITSRVATWWREQGPALADGEWPPTERYPTGG